MRWTMNTTTMRERSRRASSQVCRLSLALGGRGRGPSEQEEQRTQRASVVVMSLTRVHTHSSSSSMYVIVVGSDALWKKRPSEAAPHVSSWPDQSQFARAWTLESSADRNALGAAPDISVVDLGLNFPRPKT